MKHVLLEVHETRSWRVLSLCYWTCAVLSLMLWGGTVHIVSGADISSLLETSSISLESLLGHI